MLKGKGERIWDVVGFLSMKKMSKNTFLNATLNGIQILKTGIIQEGTQKKIKEMSDKGRINMEEWYDDPWDHLSQDDIEDACLKVFGSRTQNCGKCSFNENGYCYQKDRQVEIH